MNDATGVAPFEEAQERAAFEAHIERTCTTPDRPFNREKTFYRTENGSYFHGWLGSQWEGWKARAALGVREGGNG